MSRVFAATETALGRSVVVKVLPPLIVSEAELHRFAAGLRDVLAGVEAHLFRSYASLGFELGRRSLAAR